MFGSWQFCLTSWRKEFEQYTSHPTPTLQSSQVRSHWYCGVKLSGPQLQISIGWYVAHGVAHHHEDAFCQTKMKQHFFKLDSSKKKDGKYKVWSNRRLISESCLTGWRMEFKPCNSHSRYATPTLQSSQVRSHWYCGICAGLAKRLPIVVRVFVLPFIRAPVAADMSLLVFPSSWRCVLSNQHETSLFQTRFLLKKRMTSTKHDPPKGEGQNGKALLGKKLFTIFTFRLNRLVLDS